MIFLFLIILGLGIFLCVKFAKWIADKFQIGGSSPPQGKRM